MNAPDPLRYACRDCLERQRGRLANKEIAQLGWGFAQIFPTRRCDCGAAADYTVSVTQWPPQSLSAQ